MPVGFDFGDQSSYIGVARAGGIETLANEQSERLTPSFVSFGTNQRFLGASAKNQMVSNLKNTVYGWKKLIGRKFSDPVVQKELKCSPYQIVEGPKGNAGIQVQYLGETHVFTPEQLTAMIFTKLKGVAEKALGTKVVDCVLSVPCYFPDVSRRAYLEASQMAGLNCLRLINDTTAVAIAYGLFKQDLPEPEAKPRHVVFVDMGHTDLQLSVCAFNKGKLKVLATSSDPFLGGHDFNQLLADHFAEDFKKRYKVDAHTKPRAYIRLMSECEKLKKQMSANSTDLPVNIECFMDDKDVSGRMNRATFEELASGLLGRVEKTMRNLLEYSKLKIEDLHSVELVGGSSRVPAIKQLVQSVFGKECSTTLNADEAVARGCAIQCAIQMPTFRVRDFSWADSQPYSINITYTGDTEGDNTMEVFPQLHAFPFSKMLSFYRSAPFEIDAWYTNPETVPHPTAHIGKFLIKNVVPQADGSNSKVKVKVRINSHGLFTVASASMVEKYEEEVKEEVKEEPMETEEAKKAEDNGPKAGETTPSEGGEPKEASETSEQQSPMETESSETVASEAGASEKVGSEEEEAKQEGGKGEKKKTKTKTKTIDLPITAQVEEMTPVELNELIEKENQFIMQDKLEKERCDAKNGLEEYIYMMRDKLSSDYEKFVTEKDRESFSSKLTQMEDWLYEDGEDEKKHMYIDRLTELKKIGQPIADRHRESEARPVAFEKMAGSLVHIRKVVDLYAAKDDKYAHLDSAEMDKVSKCLKEKQQWFEKQQNLQSKKLAHEPPVVLASQIDNETKALENTCHPIINKPKPKPKEEPPKDEGSKDSEKNGDKNNSNNTATPETKEGETVETAEGETAPPATESGTNPEMEVD